MSGSTLFVNEFIEFIEKLESLFMCVSVAQSWNQDVVCIV